MFLAIGMSVTNILLAAHEDSQIPGIYYQQRPIRSAYRDDPPITATEIAEAKAKAASIFPKPNYGPDFILRTVQTGNEKYSQALWRWWTPIMANRKLHNESLIVAELVIVTLAGRLYWRSKVVSFIRHYPIVEVDLASKRVGLLEPRRRTRAPIPEPCFLGSLSEAYALRRSRALFA